MAGFVMKALMGAATVGFAYDQYRTQREKGRNPATALGISAGTAFLWNEFQWPLMAMQLAPLGNVAARGLFNKTAALQRQSMPFAGLSGFQDSAAAQTSRARAIEAIQDSRMNARSYLGSEAGLFAARYK